MAGPPVVQSTSASGSGVTSVATTSMTTTTGHGVILTAASGPDFTGFTDSKTNTWSLVDKQTFNPGAGELDLNVSQCASIVGGSGHTFTASFSASDFVTISAVEFSGQNPANMVDAGSLVAGNPTVSPYSITSNGFATTTETAFLAISSYSSGTSTYAESTGFTLQQSQPNGSSVCPQAVFTKSLSATTAVSPSVTDSTGTGYSGMIMIVFGLLSAVSQEPLLPVLGREPIGRKTASHGLIARFMAQGAPIGLIAPTVTAALTEISGTGSVGTVVPSTSVALTQDSGTGSVGTVVPNLSIGLTQDSATGSVGTVTPALSVGLTQDSATGSVGTVTPNLTIGLTQISATGSLGNLTASTGGNVSVALTQISGTGSLGNLTPNTAVALAEVAGTGSVGTLSPATAIGLTQDSATGSVGTMAPSASVALTQDAATGSLGTLAPVHTQALTQNAATGSVGTMVPGTAIGLTQDAGVGSLGTITAQVTGNVTVALTGISCTGSVGSVTASGGNHPLYGAAHSLWSKKRTEAWLKEPIAKKKPDPIVLPKIHAMREKSNIAEVIRAGRSKPVREDDDDDDILLLS